MPALKYRTTLPRPDDPDILDTMYREIASGTPTEYAATLAGIVPRTAWDWLAQGRAALEASSHAGELGPHALFAQTIEEARAEFVRENLAYVRACRDSGQRGWLPAMTLLERRDWRNFGRLQRVEIEGEVRHLSLRGELPQAAMAELLRRGERHYIEAGADDS